MKQLLLLFMAALLGLTTSCGADNLSFEPGMDFTLVEENPQGWRLYKLPKILRDQRNQFRAEYNDGSRFNVFVLLLGALHKELEVCRNTGGVSYVSIAFTPADVTLDMSKIHFLKNGAVVPGNVVKMRRYAPDQTYNLADYTAFEPHDRELRHFNMIFPFDCLDYEDAILVLDGLSRQGKALAPLKMRLNYRDFKTIRGLLEAG
ncbi:MAG: hypothetical protein LBD82_01915 [Deltaproteobacteria bacterium]|jgi:hypothetical protein|nr:hypothetical protein [Deltaproteobacteria bacterium]